MPHVVIKLWTGTSEKQKKELAAAITQNVMAILHYDEDSVSMDEIS